jgi:hypothetical protein
MKKEKLYNPEIGTFQMMFGFPQPNVYKRTKWVSTRKTKETRNEVRK